jgi:hypothetical protein
MKAAICAVGIRGITVEGPYRGPYAESSPEAETGIILCHVDLPIPSILYFILCILISRKCLETKVGHGSNPNTNAHA